MARVTHVSAELSLYSVHGGSDSFHGCHFVLAIYAGGSTGSSMIGVTSAGEVGLRIVLLHSVNEARQARSAGALWHCPEATPQLELARPSGSTSR